MIFFGENISSRAQIRSVIGELQQAAAQSPVKAPLLMMTDQEGGHVRRLPGAPVLDVYRNPGGFIDQFGRSHSMSPRMVARLGGDFIRAQQRIGVAATAKHVPGLGAAARTQDTDQRPVTLRLSLRVLRAVDELPYRSAIAGGVRVVMVSWATYPALDSRRPAGLSTAVVRD